MFKTVGATVIGPWIPCTPHGDMDEQIHEWKFLWMVSQSSRREGLRDIDGVSHVPRLVGQAGAGAIAAVGIQPWEGH